MCQFIQQSSEGFYKTEVRPQGFPNKCLLCKVEVGKDEYNSVPNEWVYELKYHEYHAHFLQVNLVTVLLYGPLIILAIST